MTVFLLLRVYFINLFSGKSSNIIILRISSKTNFASNFSLKFQSFYPSIHPLIQRRIDTTITATIINREKKATRIRNNKFNKREQAKFQDPLITRSR